MIPANWNPFQDGGIPKTATEAEGVAIKLGHRIRQEVNGVLQSINEAVTTRAWEPLGLPDLSAYLSLFLDTDHLRIPKKERAPLFKALIASGMSYREIAKVTGDSTATISPPAPVTSVTPKPKPKHRKKPDRVKPTTTAEHATKILDEHRRATQGKRNPPINFVRNTLWSLNAIQFEDIPDHNTLWSLNAIQFEDIPDHWSFISDEAKAAALIVIRQAKADIDDLLATLEGPMVVEDAEKVSVAS
jgi:hypothetical protein